jgi:uncharacterized membrane protein
MHHEKDELQKDNKIIISWLAHHNPERDDFDDHVFYIFSYAVCIGCFAFALGAIMGLVLGNLFYYYIVEYINFPIILIFFVLCWIPSILQYSIQILRRKPLKNRKLKFIIRLLYPIGSIIFIFKSPLLGFLIAVPAGYLIVYIRKFKIKTVA